MYSFCSYKISCVIADGFWSRRKWGRGRVCHGVKSQIFIIRSPQWSNLALLVRLAWTIRSSAARCLRLMGSWFPCCYALPAPVRNSSKLQYEFESQNLLNQDFKCETAVNLLLLHKPETTEFLPESRDRRTSSHMLRLPFSKCNLSLLQTVLLLISITMILRINEFDSQSASILSLLLPFFIYSPLSLSASYIIRVTHFFFLRFTHISFRSHPIPSHQIRRHYHRTVPMW